MAEEVRREVKIIKPFDAHVHLRRGPMLKLVLPYTANQFGEAVIMPNTTQPILTAEKVRQYQEEILSALNCDTRFNPLMTIQITPKTTPDMIVNAKYARVVAGKLYPKGVTTNSEDGFGLDDFESGKAYAVFKEMQDVGMILSIHGEVPGENISPLDREKFFIGLDFLEWLADYFPNLKVIMEHLSAAEAVRRIEELPNNFAATITPHHLILTCDDVLGLTSMEIKQEFIPEHLILTAEAYAESEGAGFKRETGYKVEFPHNYCKPVANLWHDREALIKAATSGDPKFFLGTDSAPHPREKKECANPAAGIFNAPVALSLLARVFEEYNALNMLEKFVSINGRNFYGLPCPRENDCITLIKKPWTVPDQCNKGSVTVVPFLAGKELNWQVVNMKEGGM